MRSGFGAKRLNEFEVAPPAPIAHSYWVEPGRLLAGEYPGAAAAADAGRRLEALMAAGISYFIDLTQPGELPPYDHLLPPVRAADERYIVYVRKAIPDHGVPHDCAAMSEILDYLARALEVGHRVYVHCHAGIGRTGTVIGCWLRRGGLAGPEAIERLNLLWRANPRARTWPRVPETDEQERFVHDWSALAPVPERELELDLDTARAWRERYLGSLLGLACGDAMGATLQFRKPGQFAPLADLVGGGHWQLPAGAWTDDTAMSLCLAESLAAQEGFDADDLRDRYRRWRLQGHRSSTGECIGITSQVSAALQQADAAQALPAGMQAAPAGAQAVTRAGVVALFAASSPERVFHWAAAAAALTDRSASSATAARVYAALMLAAVRGAPRARLTAEARDLWEAYSGAPAADFDAALAGPEALPPEPIAALRLVVAGLRSCAGFRDGLLAIVNRGGNSDVHGALFGQLAGAVFGAEGIPKAWRGVLLARPLLQDIADRLLAAALAPRH